MSEGRLDSPKTFISYSWTSPEHEQWVVDLATGLRELGIDVILDKWDLREGADKYAYMEKMVTDPAVKKVIVVCDQVYAEKADGRMGGVGTETQIISQELYSQIAPDNPKQKFVAVATEKDDDGNAYLPTYLKGRIYIDMSAPGSYDESFEQLLRWIFDRPLHEKPELGKPPSYLYADDKVSLGTTSRFHRAVQAIRQDKPSAPGMIRDYFNTFAENLEVFRIEPEQGKEFDDQVVESIEAFLPFREEVIDLLLVIAQYRSDSEMCEAIHDFFERLIPYGFQPAGRSSWSEWDADNLKFILNELFLYAIAALLKHRRFDCVNELVEKGYYFPPGSPEVPEAGLVPFTFFRGYLKSLKYRNQRLQQRRLSIKSDLLSQRAKRRDVTFDDVMQADFILFIRDQLRHREDNYPYDHWFPDALLYAGRRHRSFEMFVRAESTKYFNRLKVVLGVSSKAELDRLNEEFRSGERQAPRWETTWITPGTLMNIDRLATRP